MLIPAQTSPSRARTAAVPAGIEAAGFWDDFAKGFGKGLNMVLGPACTLCAALPEPERSLCSVACAAGQSITQFF